MYFKFSKFDMDWLLFFKKVDVSPGLTLKLKKKCKLDHKPCFLYTIHWCDSRE